MGFGIGDLGLGEVEAVSCSRCFEAMASIRLLWVVFVEVPVPPVGRVVQPYHRICHVPEG